MKVKLRYKSEGLEGLLFLQLIKEKLTNLGKFPPLNYRKILNSPPYFEILVPSLPLQRRGTEGGKAGGEETMIILLISSTVRVFTLRHDNFFV